MILIIPYTTLVSRMMPPPMHPPRGPPPFDWRAPPPPPGPIPGPDTNPGRMFARHFNNGFPHPPGGEMGSPGSMHFKERVGFLQTTSLTLSTLEVFPGLFFIYGTYIVLLHLMHRIKVYWYRTLRQPKLVRDNERGWVIERGLADDSDELDYYFDDNPSDSFVNSSKRYTRARTGFVSGNYGHPLRVQWFMQQTGCFTVSVFIVRTILLEICMRMPQQVNGLRSLLFGRILAGPPTPTRHFMLSIVIPSVLYSIEFCMSDYLLRYRGNPSKIGSGTRSFTLPLFQRSELEPTHTRNRDTRELYNPRFTGFELTELRLPQLHEPPTCLVDQTGEEAENTTAAETDNILVNNSTRSSLEAGSSSGGGGCEKSRLFPKGHAFRGVPQTPTFGIVTASLLNAVAVSATADSRAFLFPGNNQVDDSAVTMTLPTARTIKVGSGARSLEELDTDDDLSDVDVDDDDLSDADVDDDGVEDEAEDDTQFPTSATTAALIAARVPGRGRLRLHASSLNNLRPRVHGGGCNGDGVQGDEITLPSYDDSQRQQHEMLRNNPVRAIHTQNVIQEMKGGGV